MTSYSGRWGRQKAAAAAFVCLTATTLTSCGSGEPQWSHNSATAAQAAAANAATEAPAPAPTPSPTPEVNPVRGVIRAKTEGTIASRVTARIVAMPYKTGDSFAAGALLARFDCSTIVAQLNAAKAAAEAYRKTYDTNVELDQYKAVGKNEVAVSQANLGKANAEAAAISTQLADCAVRAPYAGKVVEQIAHAREVAASGQPLMKIQSGGALEVDLIVPSNWLTWLRPGAAFDFKVDETGETVSGRVVRLGAAVDPVSKTIRITGNLDQAKGIILPGMSGSATFAGRPLTVATPRATGKDG